MKTLILISTVLLTSNCFAESITSMIFKGFARQTLRVSGDVSSFSTSVCNPCAMTYSMAGVQGLQLFTATKWLTEKDIKKSDKWYEHTKRIGWIRSILCISYAIYGIFPSNNIDTKTAVTYYCVSLTF